MTVKALFEALQGNRTHDLLVTGYLEERDGRPRFFPWGRLLYIELDRGFLRLEALRDRAQLRMRWVQELRFPTELLEEDDPVATASFGEQFMDCGRFPWPITGARYVTSPESNQEECIVAAAQLRFWGDFELFFDPFNVCGIVVGEGNRIDSWVADALSHRRLPPGDPYFAFGSWQGRPD